MPHITLPDGRLLELHSSGSPTGRPVLFAHGTPGSGFALPALEHAAVDLDLRLVTWSRPGYGTSTRQPERTVAAQAAEVESILDHLSLPRCSIIGWSAGGPHALAAAALLPDRIDAALTISSPAPQVHLPDPFRAMDEETRAELEAARLGEAALNDYLALHLIAAVSGLPLAPADQTALDPHTTSGLFNHYLHGLATGVDGWVDDDLALVGFWGFNPGRIRVPVHIWHGADDNRVPYAHAQALAAAIHRRASHRARTRSPLPTVQQPLHDAQDPVPGGRLLTRLRRVGLARRWARACLGFAGRR